MRAFTYSTNNFGHHNNVHYYFYSRYVNQGNNWSHYGLHQVQIFNQTDNEIQVVGWQMKQGRVQQDFREKVIRPGLFFTARCVPMSWGSYKAVIGALVVKIKGTNQFYTLAFEDPFHDYINKGYKGHIEQGNDPTGAISRLKDHNNKDLGWGSYEFREFDGRGKTVWRIRGGNRR